MLPGSTVMTTSTLRERFDLSPVRESLQSELLPVLKKALEKSPSLSEKLVLSTVLKLKPDLLPTALARLFGEFLEALEPTYQAALATGQSLHKSLSAHPEQVDRVAEALLQVTDQRAQRSQNELLKKAYGKLRPSAKNRVISAVLPLAQVLDRHL